MESSNEKHRIRIETWKNMKQVTDSFSLCTKSYCEYCPDFSAYSESADITTFSDLPNRKELHVIRCAHADKCEKIWMRMKAEMEAQREKSEKVQREVRGCKDKRPENGADSDNGQSDGGADRISDVREKENQGVVSESNKGGWRERVMRHFLRGH